MTERIEQYWHGFLATLPPNSAYHGRVYVTEGFGDSPELADELGRLVLNGIKTATCSALCEWEDEKKSIPQAGLLSIILDGTGEPICILETTEVTLRPFNQVDGEWARAEGEGDLSLDYWRIAHRRFFMRVLPRIGRQFTEEMPLVCERFRVIYR